MDELKSIAADDSEFADLPLALLVQIDQLADDFESACRSGREPSVDSFVQQLADLSEPTRAALAAHLQQIRAEVDDSSAAANQTLRRGDPASSTPRPDGGLPPPPLTPAIDAPVAVGEYRLLELLGSGGMGVVYKAFHTRLDLHVAIKFPRFAAGLDRTGAARFVREARLIGRLTHPHIVRRLDAGESPYGPYLVTEFIDGETLEVRVRRDGPLPFATAVQLAAQAAAALAHAHEHNVIHRDVKPSNLLLDRDGVLRVVDFGLAKVLTDEHAAQSSHASDHTQLGAFLGTVGYAAPEQLHANQTVDHRADVYALGCVIYFMLTGQPPHAGTLADRLLTERRKRKSSLRLERPDLPPGFAKPWLQMVAVDPQQRLPSMAEVQRALEQALTGEPRTPSRRKFSRRAVLSSLGCIAAIAAIAWAASSLRERDSAVAALKITPIGPPPKHAVAPFDAEQAAAHQQAWSAHLGIPVRVTNHADMPMVLIPPGEFTMGLAEAPLTAPPPASTDWRYREPDADRDLQLPRHRIALTSALYFGQTEVTNAQFRRFVDATGYVTDAERATGWGREDKGWVRRAGYSWRNLGQRRGEDEHPVINVTWNDVVALGKWLTAVDRRGTYRPPTEAEWEFACRAGATTIYSFGNNPAALAEHAWFLDNSEGRYRPVGLKPPNAFGLHDMHGNRQEWCLDNFDADFYKSSPLENPVCETVGNMRVLRGGVHTDVAAFCTASQRWSQDADDPGASGIRIVCELPASRPPLAPGQ